MQVGFWAALLSWTAWKENSKILIHTVLANNYLRNDRRKTLTEKHLEDILGIKLNGATDLSKLGAAKYAKEQIKAGNLRTSDESGRKAKTVVDDNEENKKYAQKLNILIEIKKY